MKGKEEGTEREREREKKKTNYKKTEFLVYTYYLCDMMG
jgi:hypothetical protein